MSSRLKSGRASKSEHTAMVNKTQARSETIHEQLRPGTILDPERLDEQSKKGLFPTAAFGQGHWFKPDPEDTKYEMARAIVDPKGNTPWGKASVDVDKAASYLMGKKDQVDSIKQLKLLSYLIDEKNPASQDQAYKIAPILKSYPEQLHLEQVALQEAVYTLLRDGKLGGEEDNALIYYILRPEFKFPLYPLWDPDGLIQKAALAKTGFRTIEEQAKAASGLFSPKSWSGDAEAKMDDIQIKMKLMILRRLYPGLRDKSDDFITETFVTTGPLDPITNAIDSDKLHKTPSGLPFWNPNNEESTAARQWDKMVYRYNARPLLE